MAGRKEAALTKEEFEQVLDVFKILKVWRDQAAAKEPENALIGDRKNEVQMGQRNLRVVGVEQ